MTTILATDLSNAYNMVDHALLLQKMEHIGLRGKTLLLIESYLPKRMTFCEVQGYYSQKRVSKPVSVIQGGNCLANFLVSTP